MLYCGRNARHVDIMTFYCASVHLQPNSEHPLANLQYNSIKVMIYNTIIVCIQKHT